MNPRKGFYFTGNLGADPELSTTPKGRSYCRFSICINTRYKDKDSGENKKISEWFYPVIWGKRAETFVKIAKKGALVALHGVPSSNSVEVGGKKYQTPGFTVDSFEILTYPGNSDNNSSGDNYQQKETKTSTPQASSSPVVKEKAVDEDNINYSLDDDEENGFENILESDDSDEIPF